MTLALLSLCLSRLTRPLVRLFCLPIQADVLALAKMEVELDKIPEGTLPRRLCSAVPCFDVAATLLFLFTPPSVSLSLSLSVLRQART